MIAFLYGRVSTNEQDTEMQVREMSEFCTRRSWSTERFLDTGWSGAKEKRPELGRMMKLVRQRKCDVVIVYRFDRFARSLKFLLAALEEFKALGIQFISVQENIDTSLPHGELLFQIFGAIAQFERALIRERVRSGMANAKAKGIRCGRPSKYLDAAHIRTRRSQGATWSAIAAELKVSPDSCQRAARIAAKGYSQDVQ